MLTFSNVDTWWRWVLLGVCFYAVMDWGTDNLYWAIQGKEPTGKNGSTLKQGLFFDGCFPIPVAAAAITVMLAVLAGVL